MARAQDRSAQDSNARERKVLHCWQASARHWQQLLDSNQLRSRAITNPAILQAVLQYQPASVLDVGCGEGWLARALCPEGITVTGIDAVATLVEHARGQDANGAYYCLEYDALPGPLAGHPFDLAVCNFSLFGDASVRLLITRLLSMLSPRGHLLIQTLHPLSASQGDYREGWRDSRWQGIGSAGKDMGEAPPWYFRTMSGWLNLLNQSGQVVFLQEPQDPATSQPLSLLIHVRPR